MLIIIIDKTSGILFHSLYNRTNDKTISKIRYAFDSTNQEVIILGSSRAQHHYIPVILNSDSLVNSYNCGFGGQGLEFSYIQLFEITKRYNPKLVVLDIAPNILLDKESKEKIKILLPYAKQDKVIFQLLTEGDRLEKIKLLSNIYPYNSMILNLIMLTANYKIDTNFGYIPLFSKIDTTTISKQLDETIAQELVPENKFEFLDKIVDLCNQRSIKLMIVVSPYYITNSWLDKQIKQVANRCSFYQNIVFKDYSKYSGTIKNGLVFKDYAHLNNNGAILFSRKLSKDLRNVLCTTAEYRR